MKKEYIQPSVISVDVETSNVIAESANKSQYTFSTGNDTPTSYVPGESEDAAASYRSSLWGE